MARGCRSAKPVRFDQNFADAAYDPHFANTFWRILVHVDTVLKEFRARFIGKCTVNFFWGSFDLCVTRFSGLPAPERAGADSITREAYSHEVISAGFWPGSGAIAGPAFYAYAAYYSRELSEHILMYDDVRSAKAPGSVLLDFFQSTYDAGATLGNWDRKSLERGSP